MAVAVDGRLLFEDSASGAQGDRPGLIRALAFVQSGDKLLAWKFDRLGRRTAHFHLQRHSFWPVSRRQQPEVVFVFAAVDMPPPLCAHVTWNTCLLEFTVPHPERRPSRTHRFSRRCNGQQGDPDPP
ncbi:MAG: recombinase family protein [Steroidobacteraceae bacterium]